MIVISQVGTGEIEFYNNVLLKIKYEIKYVLS